MTISLTEEQVAYLQEFVSERLEENLDLEEAEMLHDLADKLSSDYDDGDDFITMIATISVKHCQKLM